MIYFQIGLKVFWPTHPNIFRSQKLFSEHKTFFFKINFYFTEDELAEKLFITTVSLLRVNQKYRTQIHDFIVYFYLA